MKQSAIPCHVNDPYYLNENDDSHYSSNDGAKHDFIPDIPEPIIPSPSQEFNKDIHDSAPQKPDQLVTRSGRVVKKLHRLDL